MKEKELIICRGVPASGKSTWSHNWVKEDPENRIRVNRDDIRKQLGPYWIPSRENLISLIERNTVYSALLCGYSVVLDATNFKFSEKEFFNNETNNEVDYFIKKFNIKIIYKDFFDVSLKDCILRDSKRENSVGKIIIERMYQQQLKLINDNNTISG